MIGMLGCIFAEGFRRSDKVLYWEGTYQPANRDKNREKKEIVELPTKIVYYINGPQLATPFARRTSRKTGHPAPVRRDKWANHRRKVML